jgi:diamine N-acetyltransferase
MDAKTREWARTHLQKRAAEDPTFRQALLADPRAAITQEFGEGVPPDYEFQVVEETPTRLCLVLSPPGPNRSSRVTLREVTAENVRSVCNLEVKEEQRGFVATNAVSIAQAHFAPKAWFRAVYADDTPVGFVMLRDDPEAARYYVWRFMVGGEYQGYGFGQRAMEQVIEYVRTRPGATEVTLSYVPGEGSARDFYRRLGFEDTGETHGGECVMRLALG